MYRYSIERNRSTHHLIEIVDAAANKILLSLGTLNISKRYKQINKLKFKPNYITIMKGINYINTISSKYVYLLTCIVATALRTSIIMIGETTNTSASIAIPATSLLLASCKVEFT